VFIITIEGMEDEGAFAVKDSVGQKVVFLFEEEDDALRYSIQLEANGSLNMVVVEVGDAVAIGACEKAGIKYTIITKDDIVVPPPDDDD
tara:strand:+ start:1064 stop:1330 length:267 start_codon:yes stop_codon:yes gene_type:complete